MRNQLVERVITRHKQLCEQEQKRAKIDAIARRSAALAAEKAERQLCRERDGHIDDWSLLRRWPRPRDGRSWFNGWGSAQGLTYKPGPGDPATTRRAGRYSGFGDEMDTFDGVQFCGSHAAETALRAVLVGEWRRSETPATTGHSIILWRTQWSDLATNRHGSFAAYLVPTDEDAQGQMAQFVQLLEWRPPRRYSLEENPPDALWDENPWSQLRWLVPWLCGPDGVVLSQSVDGAWLFL